MRYTSDVLLFDKVVCDFNPDDVVLLDLVGRQTLGYFWDFAHPVSGLARECSNITSTYGHEVVTTGGSGFGVMAIIAGAE